MPTTRDIKKSQFIGFLLLQRNPIPNSVSLVLLFYILFPECFDDISDNDDVDSSNGHDGRSKHRGWRNKVTGIFHHLFGGKVYEEREKEDHEAVEEKSEQG